MLVWQRRSNLLLRVCLFWVCIYFWKSGTWRAGLVPNLVLWGCWFPLVAENILSTSLGQDGQGRCHHLCLLWIHSRHDVYVWQQMYDWLAWEKDEANSVAGWAFSFHHLAKCQHTKFELLCGHLAHDTASLLGMPREQVFSCSWYFGEGVWNGAVQIHVWGQQQELMFKRKLIILQLNRRAVTLSRQGGGDGEPWSQPCLFPPSPPASQCPK